MELGHLKVIKGSIVAQGAKLSFKIIFIHKENIFGGPGSKLSYLGIWGKKHIFGNISTRNHPLIVVEILLDAYCYGNFIDIYFFKI